MTDAGNIGFREEVIRKLIHLTSLSIPTIYTQVSREFALSVLIPLALIALFIDIGQHFFAPIRTFMQRYFGALLRPHEKDEKKILLNGATYVLISAVLCVAIFPKVIMVTAFSILIISDISSALIGRAFGRHRFLDKSLEGSVAFAISAFLTVYVIGTIYDAPLPYFYFGALAGIVGAVAEAASIRLRMDDNLTIPLSIGFTLWGLLFLLDPATRNAILSMIPET